MPTQGLVLEVASGTGEHITHLPIRSARSSAFSRAIRTPQPEPASTRGFNQRASATSSRPSPSTRRQKLGQLNKRMHLSASI
jgi:hypothetical protein